MSKSFNEHVPLSYLILKHYLLKIFSENRHFLFPHWLLLSILLPRKKNVFWIVYTAKLRVPWSSGHLKSDTAKILSQEILAVAPDTRFELLVKHWTTSYPDNVMWIRSLGYLWYIDTTTGSLSTTGDYGSFKKQKNGANVTRYLSTKQVSLTMKNLPRQTRDDQCMCGETPVDIYGSGTLLTRNEEPHVLIAMESQHIVKEVLFKPADPPVNILHQRVRCRLLIVPEKVTVIRITRITIDPIQPLWTHTDEKEETFLRWVQRGITRQTGRHRVVQDSGTCVSYCKSTTIDFADSAQLTVIIYWMHVFIYLVLKD